METPSNPVVVGESNFTFGSIVRHVYALMREFYKEILIIVAIVYIPLNVVYELLLTSLQNETAWASFRTANRAWTWLEMLIGVIASIAIIILVQAFLEKKEKMIWQDSIKQALSFWSRVFTTQITQGILLVGLFLLLVIPGIIYSVYWSLIIPIVVVLGKKNMEALDHSKKLVSGDWWKIFGWFVGLFLVAVVAAFIMSIPFMFLPDYMVVNVLSDTVMDFTFVGITIGSLLIFRHLQEKKGREVQTQVDNAVK